MNTLRSFLVFSDIFGKKPELRIGKYYSNKTKLGGFLTIFTLILIFFLIIYFGLQVINKEKPNIIFSVLSTQNPPLAYVSQTNLSFAFGMEDPVSLNQFLDESIYQAKGYFFSGRRVKNETNSSFLWNITEIELDKCKIDNFPGQYSKIYKNFPLNLMYCIKNPNQIFLLNGSFAGEAFNFFEFNIIQCNNNTSNITCKTQEEIDKALDGAFFAFSYTDNSIDPNNITYPNQIFAGDSFNTVSNKYYTEFIHSLNTVNINSNYGLIFESINTKTFLSTHQVKIMNNFVPNPSKYITYKVQLSTNIYNYNRNYMKIQDVAAQIGGMINFLLVSVGFLIYFFNEAAFLEVISNCLFVFKKKESKRNILDIKNKIQTNNFFEDQSNTMKIINELTSKKQPSLMTKFNRNNTIFMNDKNENIFQLNIQINEVLKYMFCYLCLMKKDKKLNFLINASNELIHEKLELKRLILLLEDVEKLKYLVFDREQIILFNNLPKQEVVDFNLKNTKNQKLSNIQNFYSEIENLKNINKKDVESAFEKLKIRLERKDNKIDEKLVKLYHHFN